ncbi:type 1 glutamine amidotransferase domain-containing protein [Pedobacter sp. ISL-68]|uniref:type 1 glutamine amidotransferase domain-containing protein n=1 Tax=unclassified Pedobacter TaxID=2628915 RepID=UPI001BEA5874|nr:MULTISPECIES: type 1 glutamine amidotransferase domain-containing protein [unclassified Pedobacter]MBT2560262.1 type 1 glutamine amidotransferase domain-containing protein [Pedobacter sp. ISL-64]MBT2589242.1 type 1 glutamine amidotransferase domain-containing protein [Pedobacter sp. ISL-68]
MNPILKKYSKLVLTMIIIVMLSACGNAPTSDSVAKNAGQSIPKTKNVLIVLSAENSLTLKDGTTIPTGFFLDEFAVPAQALAAAGYTLNIATPGGTSPHMDEVSIDKSYFQNDSLKLLKALSFVNNLQEIKTPLKLSDVAASDLASYAAIFIPGGRAPMVDLMENKDLGKILRYFHTNKMTTALICHGPVALNAALEDPVSYRQALVQQDTKVIAKFAKDWIYSGYRMTIFSNAEEDDALKAKKQKLPFYVADALSSSGAKLQKAQALWAPYVVRDRELITGQNPASDHALADTLVKVLNAL